MSEKFYRYALILVEAGGFWLCNLGRERGTPVCEVSFSVWFWFPEKETSQTDYFLVTFIRRLVSLLKGWKKCEFLLSVCRGLCWFYGQFGNLWRVTSRVLFWIIVWICLKKSGSFSIIEPWQKWIWRLGWIYACYIFTQKGDECRWKQIRLRKIM